MNKIMSLVCFMKISDVLESNDKTYGKSNARIKNAAISARVTGLSGQYFSGLWLQPEVIPSPYSFSIHPAAQWDVVTSVKMPVAGGGV